MQRQLNYQEQANMSNRTIGYTRLFLSSFVPFQNKGHREIQELKCQHEEADTRIVLHVNHTCEQVLPKIFVCCIDTDDLVILLFYMVNTEGFVLMDVEHERNNTHRYVDVTKCWELGSRLCSALPALHAFTGCEYTAGFLCKGKARPVDMAAKSDQFLKAFGQLGTSADMEKSIEDAVGASVCSSMGSPILPRETMHTILCSETKMHQNIKNIIWKRLKEQMQAFYHNLSRRSTRRCYI